LQIHREYKRLTEKLASLEKRKKHYNMRETPDLSVDDYNIMEEVYKGVDETFEVWDKRAEDAGDED
ncbi:hypothetical protein PENTCL1PPCAC_4542, partial [Pristionchus entomophagus]